MTSMPPQPRNMRTGRKPPQPVMEIDWPFFGELCRGLALKVFREFDPQLVIGIAKAGVIPGAVGASILQCDFAFNAVRELKPAAVKTAVSFRCGDYQPDFWALATQSFIILPWDREVIVNG